MSAIIRLRLGLSRAALIGAISLSSLSMNAPMAASAQGTFLPTGQYVTPNSVPNAIFQPLNPGIQALPDFVAGGAVSTALSPDGRTLAVLTCGYNSVSIPGSSINNEYIFIYNVSADVPAQAQVITLANTFVGITFSTDGTTL
jgi:hypothetical protein